MSEWIALGQVLMATGKGLLVAETLLGGITPNAGAMRANIDAPLSNGGRGLIYAEALQFALTDRMSRPDAQAAVKELCTKIIAEGGSLKDMAVANWDDPELAKPFTPEAQLGLAPADARGFAAMVRG